MNFAPYQDAAPQIERALSPPPSGLKSPPIGRPTLSSRSGVHALPSPDVFVDVVPRSVAAGQERGQSLEAFQTSLPMRLDHEAMLAYLLLPPAGSVMLLLLEHKSDYVRFHAWQAAMLFSAIFVLHLLLSWSRILSWLVFGMDIVLIGFLSLHAYRDVETLEHYEIPLVGRLANAFLDDE